MTRSRYEKIIENAMVEAIENDKEESTDEYFAFMCGWLKTEIRHLLKEIETLEAKCQTLTNPAA